MPLRLAIPILAACIAIPLTAQTTTIQPSTPKPTTETRTFTLKSGGNLIIDCENGDISVSSWDKDEVALKADFTPSSRRNVHSKVEIESDVNSLKLTVEHPRERNENKASYVNLELKVPNHLAASCIKTRRGSLTLEGIIGKINAETKYGDIDLKDFSGNINVETKYGDVRGSIQNIEDNLYASTKYGSIRLKLLNPNGALTASTIYGNIRIPPGAKNVKADKTNRTSTIIAKYDGNANMQFDTKYGNIVIQ